MLLATRGCGGGLLWVCQAGGGGFVVVGCLWVLLIGVVWFTAPRLVFGGLGVVVLLWG